MKIGVLTNPNSRKNKTKHGHEEQLRRVVGDWGIVRRTRSVEEVKDVVAEFLEADLAYWVADGGDGALHWMLNEGLRASAVSGAALPPISPSNGGTIDFVAGKVGIRTDVKGIIDRLVFAVQHKRPPVTVTLDTVRLLGFREKNSTAKINAVGFAAAIAGVGQKFFDYFYAQSNPNASTILTIIVQAVLGQLLQANQSIGGKRADRLRQLANGLLGAVPGVVKIDELLLPYSSFTAVHAGAIDINLGGVVRVFPLARTAGKLHLQAGSLQPWDIIRNLPSIFRGSAIHSPNIVESAGSTLTMEVPSGTHLRPVFDGEVYPEVSRVEVSLGPQVRIPVVDTRRS